MPARLDSCHSGCFHLLTHDGNAGTRTVAREDNRTIGVVVMNSR